MKGVPAGGAKRTAGTALLSGSTLPHLQTGFDLMTEPRLAAAPASLFTAGMAGASFPDQVAMVRQRAALEHDRLSEGVLPATCAAGLPAGGLATRELLARGPDLLIRRLDTVNRGSGAVQLEMSEAPRQRIDWTCTACVQHRALLDATRRTERFCAGACRPGCGNIGRADSQAPPPPTGGCIGNGYRCYCLAVLNTTWEFAALQHHLAQPSIVLPSCTTGCLLSPRASLCSSRKKE